MVFFLKFGDKNSFLKLIKWFSKIDESGFLKLLKWSSKIDESGFIKFIKLVTTIILRDFIRCDGTSGMDFLGLLKLIN